MIAVNNVSAFPEHYLNRALREIEGASFPVSSRTVEVLEFLS